MATLATDRPVRTPPEGWWRRSRRSVALAGVVFALAGAVGWRITQSEESRLLGKARTGIQIRLDGDAAALTTAIGRRQALVTGVAAFAAAHAKAPSFAREFELFAAGLQAYDPIIRAIQIFPHAGPVLVYPELGNATSIGRTLADLIDDDRPAVRADVRRAIASGRIAVSNPYELRQGGMGVVARMAVRRDGDLWGLVVVILDIGPLMELPGLSPAPRDLRLAFRDGAGQVFLGSREVFDSDPVVSTVSLAEGSWTIAASPRDG